MFQRMIDDVKREAGVTVRLSSLAVATAFALFITTAFLCAAAFAFVLERYGLIYACLSGAGVFAVLTLGAMTAYLIVKRRAEQRAAAIAAAAKSSASNFFSDPAMLATGLQILRIVGVKRMVPLLAIGGIALGLLSRREQKAEAPAE